MSTGEPTRIWAAGCWAVFQTRPVGDWADSRRPHQQAVYQVLGSDKRILKWNVNIYRVNPTLKSVDRPFYRVTEQAGLRMQSMDGYTAVDLRVTLLLSRRYW